MDQNDCIPPAFEYALPLCLDWVTKKSYLIRYCQKIAHLCLIFPKFFFFRVCLRVCALFLPPWDERTLLITCIPEGPYPSTNSPFSRWLRFIQLFFYYCAVAFLWQRMCRSLPRSNVPVPPSNEEKSYKSGAHRFHANKIQKYVTQLLNAFLFSVFPHPSFIPYRAQCPGYPIG